MDTLIIVAIGLALAGAFMWPHLRRSRSLEQKARTAEEVALQYGLDQPFTLHPVVDQANCIGTANCVEICPEKDVLGLRHGRAQAVSPARCVGHGLCERSCPVDAIQLVFGTARRGVDIPRIQENFETNVPGLFVIGELGGMGLIRNAFEQGRQCIEGLGPVPAGLNLDCDLLIVGCGPAGLAASLHAQRKGLRFMTIEREDVGGAVRSYPRKKLVMAGALDIPGYGRLSRREIVKEELIDLWDTVVDKAGLEVLTGQEVQTIQARSQGGFMVSTPSGSFTAFRVVLAIGRRGVPRKLGIPGEDSPKVLYSLREPEAYSGDRVLVVGGGDSAVEAALSLAEQSGTEVHISYRRSQFSRIKPGNLERIEAAMLEGRVQVIWSSNVTRIEHHQVIVTTADGMETALVNDYTFVFAGGVLPTDFLVRSGVIIDTKFGDPI